MLAREQSASLTGSGKIAPEQEAIAKKAQKRAEEGRPQEALVILSNADDVLRSERLVDQFGVERDESTGEKKRNSKGTSEEDERYKRATDAKKMITEYLDGGIAAVTNRDALIKIVIDEALRSNPALAAEVSIMTTGSGGEQEAFALRMLKDPKMSSEVKRLFKQFLDNPRAELRDATVANAQLRRDEAEREKTRVDEEIADNGTEDTNNDRAYSEFQAETEDSITKIKRTGKRYAELETAEASIGTLQTDLVSLRDTEALAEAEINNLQREESRTLAGHGTRAIAEVDHDLDIERTRYKNAKKDIAKKEQELANAREKRLRLEAERDAVTSRRQVLKAAKRQLAHDLREKTAVLASREQELRDAKRLRGVEENDIVSGLQSIIKEAVQGVFDARIKENDAALVAELNEMKAAAQTKVEKEMSDALQHRHFDAPVVRRVGWGFKEVEVRPINTTLVESDYNQLMTNGPEGLIEKTLLDQLTGVVNPETGAVYTNGEISDAATKISPAMKEAAVRELLTKKVMSHGISRQDIFIISGTEWGKGMIEKALAARADLRKQVNTALGEHVLNDRNLWQRFRYRFANQPGLFKALLVPGLLFSFSGAVLKDSHEGHADQGLAVG